MDRWGANAADHPLDPRTPRRQGESTDSPGKTSASAARSREGSAPSLPSVIPTLSLPKSGGIIRGLGEKFQTNGVSDAARVADPQHPWRVSSWLLERSEDARGDTISYLYKAEDLSEVPTDLNERGRRDGLAGFTNRYLKRVRYGNRVVRLPALAAPGLGAQGQPAGPRLVRSVQLEYRERPARGLWKAGVGPGSPPWTNPRSCG